MEKLKDPAMILSLVDLCGLKGITYHFHRKCEQLNAELQKNSQTLNNSLQKIAELSQDNRQLRELVAGFTRDLAQITDTVTSLPTKNTIRVLTEDIKEVAQVLGENNITVNLPSKEVSRRRLRDDREDRDIRGEWEDRDLRNNRREHEERPRLRERLPIPIGGRRPHPPPEDDADLIDQVRQQTG